MPSDALSGLAILLAAAYYFPSMAAGLKRRDFLFGRSLAVSVAMYATYAIFYAGIFHFHSQPVPLPLAVAGVALCIAGVIIHAEAIDALGDEYSAHNRAQGVRTVMHGPYSQVRHPIYSAAMLYFAGLALLLFSQFSLPLLLLVMAYLHWRIAVEERSLLGKFAGQYADYQKRVPATIVQLAFRKVARLKN
ncbi:isoprenylcysteine carboxylmethyltransferase family protein [Candidatus Micrarchaeota archaeon]|nr:isoprenylcysteine carboxylmethyltransferase family protein [Candidatus Micrarchaeota archaeon]MBI5176883.1 isoprenylcysteine carboxylmethyltransferase family protein [Candidatus Micrarchaeota archaeon]